jgi:hypothetical protein
MPFHLTDSQLDLYNRNPTEREMVKNIRLWKKTGNPEYRAAALHYFLMLPKITKTKIERMERSNKSDRPIRTRRNAPIRRLRFSG